MSTFETPLFKPGISTGWYLARQWRYNVKFVAHP